MKQIVPITCLSLLSNAIGGCIWGPFVFENDPLKNPRHIRAISPDGFVEFQDGQRVRLAGIQMRPAGVTKEPARLPDVLDAIEHRVDGQLDEASQTVACYYRSRNSPLCGNPFLLPHPLTFFHFVPKYERHSLNAMLIRTGVAEFAPDAGYLSREDRGWCEYAQRRYDIAMCEQSAKFRDKPVSWIVQFPRMGGVRLATGDVRIKSVKGRSGIETRGPSPTQYAAGADQR